MSVAFWIAYALILSELLVAYKIAFDDEFKDKYREVLYLIGSIFLEITICLGILKSFLNALDEEHYDHYHGEDARGKSVVIHHIPAIGSKSVLL